MIVEEGPSIDPGEIKRGDRHGIPVRAHVTEQFPVRRAAIPLGPATVYAIGIVVRAASGVSIIFCAIQEDAILPLGFSHDGE